MNISIEMFEEVLKEELKILPEQSPLEHFVHHNNLHHFEHEKFEDAVESVYLSYGKSPYMPLNYYRNKISKGDILDPIFKEFLDRNSFVGLNESLIDFIKKYLHTFNDKNEIKFLLDEGVVIDIKTGKQREMLKQEVTLWESLSEIEDEQKILEYPDFHINRSVERVNKIIIPYLSIMLDQGLAAEFLPDKDRADFWTTFVQYLKPILTSKQLKKAQSLFKGEELSEVIFSHYLSEFTNRQDLQSFIRIHLQSLPGWAGLINKVSKNKETIPRKDVSLNIYKYLLCRLFVSSEIGAPQKKNMIAITSSIQIKLNAFYYLSQFDREAKPMIVIDLFKTLNPLVLRRIFQQSLEASYHRLILTGLCQQSKVKTSQTKYQMFFCLDDREESFRRHIEEVSSEVETYGVAGFFGFDMMYQKVNEPRARRFCPPAASPKFLVKEKGSAKTFKFASFMHDSHSGFLNTTIQSFLLAPIKAFDSNLHLFFPREKKKISTFIQKSDITEIDYINEGTGYSKEQVAQRVANILKGAGVINIFAPYLIIIGHGHNSYNNPHVSAYRCGACSGANAAPNARIFAQAANTQEIREILKNTHNIDIPDTTYFIGGFHDTCSDDIQLFDLDNKKFSTLEQEKLNKILLETRSRNAKERCRKFYQLPEELSKEEALKQVQSRAWRVAEPRPELNHATNTLCIVGKRDLTRNVFLDRKSFLVSYDYSTDANGVILAGLLGAVVPVCSGINLEYYFSKVDTENYGSGSKTSHNVTGLVAVSNGVRGDLRTGLVWQMVEYHEPLRLLFIIESTPDDIEKIMQNNKEVSNIIQNKWIYVALINPKDSTDIQTYSDGQFKPFSPTSFNIEKFSSSNEVPTCLASPVHIANIGDRNNV